MDNKIELCTANIRRIEELQVYMKKVGERQRNITFDRIQGIKEGAENEINHWSQKKYVFENYNSRQGTGEEGGVAPVGSATLGSADTQAIIWDENPILLKMLDEERKEERAALKEKIQKIFADKDKPKGFMKNADQMEELEKEVMEVLDD